MNRIIILAITLLGLNPIYAQQEKILAPTPPMGFISWNLFEGNISEDIVKSLADAMVENGLKDAGYEYIILDDLWHGERDENGNIQPDPKKFPNGIKVVADYVHSKGLKFGIYTDIAEKTCAGMEGSLGFETQDAQTYAAWGVDYIKCDYCYAPKDVWTAVERYTKFIEAVRATDRDIVFALCEWGQRSPWLWGERVGAQLWRTTWDLRDTWEHGRYGQGYNGIMEALDRQVGLEQYAGPGHWNDPDMLVIGLKGTGSSSSARGAAGCTSVEYEAQMGLWSLLAAPLLMTCDIRDMDADTKRILTNKEVIAINQDVLGKQASRVLKNEQKEIFVKPLADGSWAVGLLNRNGNKTTEITLDLSKQLKINGEKVRVRDLWLHKDLGEFDGTVALDVAPHQCRMLRIEVL
ncbi:glycoside hydrolase family 27 protein [Reichenbachiella carrageenanivorans]|uniref:Alpha-galactosidase n=1 Tax=Reichenbachiella carrageenanivorans TaxID=2979869 RepID=A0ABY6D4A0_9BACT|nr:glycoside hydrolase family 27 protein [Reichenbachiella carrageenanivorans]UXX80986.1 glycoside hydrolase family 27 protein [Reichenbachiella carrageenanivorans]